MLYITVPAVPSEDLWDEKNNKFVKSEAFEGAELLLEHSLVSLSKWESITEKAFLGDSEKTREDTLLYIECMLIAPIRNPAVFRYLTPENIKEIDDYIGRKMTATTINDIPGQKNGKGEFITADLIYYWMIALQIPFECQYWHLSKLTTLIRVTNIKNQPEKKPGRPTKASLANRRSLAAQARARHGTRG